MKIRITAAGIFDAAGKEVPVGTRLTVKKEPAAWAGRYEVEDDEEGKTSVTNPKKGGRKAEGAADGSFAALEKDGAWVIADAEGNVIGKPLTAEDAKAFNDLSDEDKAAFVAEHAKA